MTLPILLIFYRLGDKFFNLLKFSETFAPFYVNYLIIQIRFHFIYFLPYNLLKILLLSILKNQKKHPSVPGCILSLSKVQITLLILKYLAKIFPNRLPIVIRNLRKFIIFATSVKEYFSAYLTFACKIRSTEKPEPSLFNHCINAHITVLLVALTAIKKRGDRIRFAKSSSYTV